MGKFCMKLTYLKPNTKYMGLLLHVYTGNTGDCFFTPLPISRAWGEKQSYGSLFAYLFRRFGYPNIGWDDYKELAAYYLSTPLPDMILKVVPYAGDDTSLHFHFLVEAQTLHRLEAFDCQARTDMKNRMLDWIEANNLLPEWMEDFVTACNRDIRPVSGWREAFPELYWFTSEKTGSDHKILGDWYTLIINRYKEIEPDPGHKTRTLDWSEWPDDDPLKKYHQAAYEALQDLKRPVNVRDAHINGLGRVDDCDLSLNSAVGYTKVAGYPSGMLGNEAPKEFSELHSLVYKLGNGNAKRGLRKVMQHCKVQKDPKPNRKKCDG